MLVHKDEVWRGFVFVFLPKSVSCNITNPHPPPPPPPPPPPQACSSPDLRLPWRHHAVCLAPPKLLLVWSGLSPNFILALANRSTEPEWLPLREGWPDSTASGWAEVSGKGKGEIRNHWKKKTTYTCSVTKKCIDSREHYTLISQGSPASNHSSLSTPVSWIHTWCFAWRTRMHIHVIQTDSPLINTAAGRGNSYDTDCVTTCDR